MIKTQNLNESKSIFQDQWLSQIFGCDVYRIEATALDEQSKEVLKALQTKDVFLYGKVSTERTDLVKSLCQLNFYLIDTNVTLSKQPSSATSINSTYEVRFAMPNDENQVASLARNNCTTSRFHLDSHISRNVAGTIKEEWARNFFKGKRGEKMVVASNAKGIVGFLQLLRNQDNLIIDLIATDQSERRKGIASDMVAFAESLYKNQCATISVGTQISNTGSMRLYEKLGFRVSSAQYIFHYLNG